MANENNIDYDGKSFIPKLNSANGEVSEQTVFHYHQNCHMGRICRRRYLEGISDWNCG